MRVVPLDRPPACSEHVCIESCLPIGWCTFIWWKINQSATQFWFVLLDVGVLYSQAVIQRTIDVSPAFLEHGSAEKITVWAYTNHDPNKQEVGFISSWNGSELWTLIKYSRSKVKNQKPIAVSRPIQCISNGGTFKTVQGLWAYKIYKIYKIYLIRPELSGDRTTRWRLRKG
jgi:hypothetical protein